MMHLSIEKARPEDREEALALLAKTQLVTDDLPPDLAGFWVIRDKTACIGVAGLERFGTVGLLRSVAVDPAFRGNRLAARLISRLLETAEADGLDSIYLITTTADRYFERHGFGTVDRQDVPEAIRQTQQFSALCPASAVVMKRTVNRLNE
ncbi:arsenic resistance N-acetyltransferase ArsN2 [Larkinella sp. VNQ87]|uniref:arsenic resistance N-acetyltransferase ArsN2 n=1 Tax=Larkinella sp. VNQ87 TaxID=3400921 RepID=UPI003C082E9B